MLHAAACAAVFVVVVGFSRLLVCFSNCFPLIHWHIPYTWWNCAWSMEESDWRDIFHAYILSQTHDFQFVRREIGWGRPHYQSMFQLVLLKILNSDTVDLSHSQRSHASPIIIEINFQHCTHIFGKFIIIRWDYSLLSAFFFLLIAFWVVELDRV